MDMFNSYVNVYQRVPLSHSSHAAIRQSIDMNGRCPLWDPASGMGATKSLPPPNTKIGHQFASLGVPGVLNGKKTNEHA